jgi:hypothetical protein
VRDQRHRFEDLQQAGLVIGDSLLQARFCSRISAPLLSRLQLLCALS